MEAVAEKKIWTDEELMALPRNGNRYELVNGVLQMSPTGSRHGEISMKIALKMDAFVSQNKLGVVLPADVGYKLRQGNVRSPDVSFVCKERLSGLKHLPKGFFEGSPDLAIEVLSPDDTIEALHQKIVEYFENGTRLCWVVNSEEETVYVYHSPAPDVILSKKDFLNGEDVIPGFKLAVAELFAAFEF